MLVSLLSVLPCRGKIIHEQAYNVLYFVELFQCIRKLRLRGLCVRHREPKVCEPGPEPSCTPNRDNIFTKWVAINAHELSSPGFCTECVSGRHAVPLWQTHTVSVW